MLVAAAERLDAAAFGVLAPEIRSAFHLSDAAFVPIVALTSVLPLLLSVPLANWADRTNRVTLCAAAAVLWGGTAILTGVAPVLSVLIIARLAGGLGQTVYQPVHASLLADWYPPEGLATMFAFYLIGSQGLGLVAGPLSGALGGVVGWRWTFVVLAVPTFVLAPFVLRLREPQRGESAGIGQGPERITIFEGFRRLKPIRGLRRTWLAAFFFGAGFVSFIALFSLFLKDEYHIGGTARGAVTALFGVGGIIGFAIAGRASQRALREQRPGRLAWIAGGLVVEFAVAIALVAVIPIVWVSIAVVFVAGIGGTAFLVPYQTLVAMVVAPKLRSQAFAWSLIFFTIGALVLSGVIGEVGDVFGERYALVVLAVFVALGGILGGSAGRFVPGDMERALQLASDPDDVTEAVAGESGEAMAVPGPTRKP
jgi:MFS family permease